MRYHIKGGTWKNAEDEVLKAAVMKYGLNQWARVSSLLVRKSAKQCKERWYEWLDPKIKKTEWSKEEEEKLLHLIKMFPCQWKTIAPFIGRTSYQCLEHYEYLLDKIQNKDPYEFDPRKLRQNEIDPNPEAKPARPDPIDLDEETKETLNEARARVANTRGKKAKRKIREKQLDDARRLATLQKNRELKSAGIEIVVKLPRKKRKELNYNTDIPFMREAPIGSFSDKLEEVPEVDIIKSGISLQYLENKYRDINEENSRKVDEIKIKNLVNKNLPLVFNKINQMNDPINLIRREKLSLSEPTIDEDNLKMMNKDIDIDEQREKEGENNCTDLLKENNLTNNSNNINNSKVLSINSSVRAQLTKERIIDEAKIAIGISECETPLIGGANSRDDLNSYLRKRKESNNLNNQNNNSNNYNFKSPLPVNKSFLQNKTHRNSFDSNTSNIDEGIVFNNSNNIKLLFSNLPKPKNTFETNNNFNEDELNQLKNQDNNELLMKRQIEQDAEDKEKEENKNKENQFEEELLMRTDVIKNNLPRINLTSGKLNNYLNNMYNINLKSNNSNNEEIEENEGNEDNLNDLIKENIIKLIVKDNKSYPFKGMNINEDFDSFLNEDEDDEEDKLTLERKKDIEKLIEDEVTNLKNKNMDKYIIQLYNEIKDNNISFNKQNSLFVYKEKNDKNNKFDYYEEQLNIKKKVLQKENKYKESLIKNINIINHKLNEKKDNLIKEYKELTSEIYQLNKNKNIYQNMLDEEEVFFRQRMKKKEDELQKLCEYKEKLINKKLNNK